MQDDISIIIGGATITGWTRVRLTRGIERMPSDFEIELTEYYPADNTITIIVAGSPCQVKLGDDVVITGYVDEVETKIEGESHSISIYGRSKSEDLVDCSAEWPNAQISSAKVLQIAKNIASAYNIEVNQNITPDAAVDVIPQINFLYGETAVNIIERICRYAKLLFYDMPDGSILLTTASSKKAASGFMEGVNVLSATSRFTMTRFREYICVLVSFLQWSDGMALNSGQNNSANSFGQQTDESVARNRKKYIVVESGDYGGTTGANQYPVTRARALWEKNRRAGKAFEVRILTDGWRDVAGKLWEPNTLVDLALPSLKIPKETWLISEVTYMRDETKGTTASIVIGPAQSFIPEPIILVPQPFPDIIPANKQGSTVGGNVNLPPPPDTNALVQALPDQDKQLSLDDLKSKASTSSAPNTPPSIGP